jgi:hypothetical protein
VADGLPGCRFAQDRLEDFAAGVAGEHLVAHPHVLRHLEVGQPLAREAEDGDGKYRGGFSHFLPGLRKLHGHRKSCQP